jgi:hypothetical protein
MIIDAIRTQTIILETNFEELLCLLMSQIYKPLKQQT